MNCSICGTRWVGTTASSVCQKCSNKTYTYHPCAACVAKDERIAELERENERLRAESPSDNILHEFVRLAKYAFTATSTAEEREAQSILDLRLKNREADDANT